MIYLGVCYFVFFLFGTICVSCMWISISFFPVGKCSAMMSSNMFSILFSLFPFWNLLLCLLTCFIAAYTYHFLLSFLFFFLKFFSVYGSIWMIFIILSSRSLFWITYAHRRVCHFINYSLHLDCCLSQKWNYQFLIPSSLWFLVPCLMISVYIANLSFHLAFLLPTLKI